MLDKKDSFSSGRNHRFSLVFSGPAPEQNNAPTTE